MTNIMGLLKKKEEEEKEKKDPKYLCGFVLWL